MQKVEGYLEKLRKKVKKFQFAVDKLVQPDKMWTLRVSCTPKS